MHVSCVLAYSIPPFIMIMNPLYPDCTNINTKNQFENHNKTKKQHFHIIFLKATQSLPYKEALSYQFPQLLPMESQES